MPVQVVVAVSLLAVVAWLWWFVAGWLVLVFWSGLGVGLGCCGVSGWGWRLGLVLVVVSA